MHHCHTEIVPHQQQPIKQICGQEKSQKHFWDMERNAVRMWRIVERSVADMVSTWLQHILHVCMRLATCYCLTFLIGCRWQMFLSARSQYISACVVWVSTRLCRVDRLYWCYSQDLHLNTIYYFYTPLQWTFTYTGHYYSIHLQPNKMQPKLIHQSTEVYRSCILKISDLLIFY